MMMVIPAIMVLVIFCVLFTNIAWSQTSSNSTQLGNGDQRYILQANGRICGMQDKQDYTIEQKVGALELQIPDNQTATAKMNIAADVIDPQGNLFAQNNKTGLQVVTNEGLPLEKRIILNLDCANGANTNGSNTNQFIIREDLTINNGTILFSEPSLSSYDRPSFNDKNLTAELVFQGLDFPTSISVLNSDDILALEKDKGTVQRIVNGKILDKPLIDLNVSSYAEQGLVGIAVANSTSMGKNQFVFLYFTNSNSSDTTDTAKTQGNRLVRYELVNNELVNPKLIIDIPSSYRGIHVGGKLLISDDENLYVTVGDIGRGKWSKLTDKLTQNNRTGDFPDGTGGILRFTLSGSPVNPSIIGEEYPLNLYYAYGIRNSYGIDFDPLTGNLWDSENGNKNGDELNLVEAGFNSGWPIVEGMSYLHPEFNVSNLVDFGGRGYYSDPEFNWHVPNATTAVGPTAVKFINSDKYGSDLQNDLLVANFNQGHLYRFDLNENRTTLSLSGPVADKLSDGRNDTGTYTLAKFPGSITDVQMGPDGYIYVVSLSTKKSDCDSEVPGCLVNGEMMKGAIFRIVPK